MERIAKQHDVLSMSKKLSTRTHFTSSECKSLLEMHSKILEHGTLDRLRFREVIHACFDLYEDLMLDRVFRAYDKNNDGQVDAVEWVEGCSVLIRGLPDELIDFSYFVYNINGDDTLDREELFQYLRKTMLVVPNVMPHEDLEESIRELVDICMKKLDKDRDGQITYKDFEKSCLADPLLVQCLGPCIPSTRSLAAFLACFTEEHRSYTSNWGDEWFGKGYNKGANNSQKKQLHDAPTLTSIFQFDDDKDDQDIENSVSIKEVANSFTPSSNFFNTTNSGSKHNSLTNT